MSLYIRNVAKTRKWSKNVENEIVCNKLFQLYPFCCVLQNKYSLSMLLLFTYKIIWTSRNLEIYKILYEIIVYTATQRLIVNKKVWVRYPLFKFSLSRCSVLKIGRYRNSVVDTVFSLPTHLYTTWSLKYWFFIFITNLSCLNYLQNIWRKNAYNS